ncbi:methylmalonyl-CoA mutase family protein [Aurantibacillus circumpalustris]|uniref:methylmalonyl-CoA mutase family protein n=1 Tax=Aurantibacillus circumpalustris TaxID=3036359 RepID=UPI00295BBEA4|nr:methylmalonyl-CoA mutase family protein [Aurantibacillus circumpalustris]
MQKLFTDFKPSTAEEWKNRLVKDLKGEPYESLIWHNENGFDIQPFYAAEDLKQVYEPAFTHAQWEICVSPQLNDSKELNKQLLQHLNSGATSISINCKEPDLEIALKDIQLNYIHSTFFVNEKNSLVLKKYLEANYDLNRLNCSLFPEKLANTQDFENWLKVVSLFKSYDGIKILAANALPYHDQSCLAYYEVALVLSQITEYLEFFSDKKSELPTSDIVIKTGVSSDYFIQMAKLRAIRRLWTILKKEYAVENDFHVIVETSLTNKSISDSYNNLLRTTVESMAAVSGGCNELIVTDFDVLFETNKVLAERMAVNQQLILKEESYFDKMADVACGSFYIETITDLLASKALETFKRFEKEGGYFKCLEKNIFSTEIATQAKERGELVNAKKQISIGVNKFKNEKEKIEITAKAINELKNLDIHNPVLNFELEHYFNLKNA